jgi:nitroreductase
MTEANTLERLMRARHSCRGFLPVALNDAVVDRILTIAQLSTSWCNAQPWQIIVTRGAATERFRAALQAHVTAAAPHPDIPFPAEYSGVYRERRRACAGQLYGAVGIAMDDRLASAGQAAENFRLFGAPHVAIVTTAAARGPYGAVDCGAYVAAFMLAATALGVATITQASIAAHAGFVRTHFDIPTTRHVVCGISFGLADPDHPANGFRTSRATLSEVVTRHT